MFSKKIIKTITIDGMSCNHCAKKVEEALLSIAGVKTAKVNLNKKIATIVLSSDVDNNLIKEKIENLEYKVLNIKEG